MTTIGQKRQYQNDEALLDGDFDGSTDFLRADDADLPKSKKKLNRGAAAVASDDGDSDAASDDDAPSTAAGGLDSRRTSMVSTASGVSTDGEGKKKKKHKKKKLNLRDLPFATVSEQLEFLEKHYAHATEKLTALEIPKRLPLQPESFQTTHIKKLDQLPTCIHKLCPAVYEGKSMLKKPKCVVITGNAERAWDVAKMLKDCQSPKLPFHIASLYARHMKPKEQIAFLDVKPITLAVGTPNRLMHLADEKALLCDEVTLLVFDMWRDAKQLTMFGYDQIAHDLMLFLGKHCHARLADRSLRLCFFNAES